MNDLSAHLKSGAAHSYLPFHPACPLCKDERLVGTLGREVQTPRRVAVGVVAASLIASTGVPTASLAAGPVADPAQSAEGDSESEGTSGADAPGQDEDSPANDIGGPDADVVDENSPPLVDPGDNSNPDEGENENGPLETAPPQDAPYPSEQQSGPPETGPPTSRPAPRQDDPDAVLPTDDDRDPQGGAGKQPTDDAAPQGKPDRSSDARPKRGSGTRRRGSPPTHRRGASPKRLGYPADPAGGRPTEGEPTGSLGPPRASEVQGSHEARPQRAAASRGGKRGGRRTHVVRRGESLWSIATAQLGGQPGPARVAEEVQRLWSMNAEIIGTGDPDLLLVGQEIRLD